MLLKKNKNKKLGPTLFKINLPPHLNLPSIFESEVKEGVGYLCPALAAKDVHRVPRHGDGEVTARWRAVACLSDLFPCFRLTLLKN